MMFTEANGAVQVGNNDKIESVGHGTVRMLTVFRDVRSTVLLRNVTSAPGLKYSPISIF